MDQFVSRKRRAIASKTPLAEPTESTPMQPVGDEESTEVKLGILASLCPNHEVDTLLEALLSANGSVEVAAEALTATFDMPSPRKRLATAGYQSSLQRFHSINGITDEEALPRKPMTQKGKTLHLYSPEDIADHTPCSIIHNFLPADVAKDLLHELLLEAPTFGRDIFTLFDRVVTSPHTMSFYVDDYEEAERQKTDYVYNGSRIADVRNTPPVMRKVAGIVAEAVNKEVDKRIRERYPDGKKLKYQSPKKWEPNTAFVNCYDGAKESVGYHSDQLTYLGPRAIIGSLSLGVAREFRVRKIVSRPPPSTNTNTAKAVDLARADEEGQISIHLPHNSLLVMHAEMQEEWKHSIAPAQSIEPHPLAGNKRLNITYRWYREAFHPKYTPKCHCNVPTVLRAAQKKAENRGRYMWMCHAGYTPGNKGCSFFQWAEFDDDGEPPWASNVVRESNKETTSATPT